MRVLVATKQTQGQAEGDFAWVDEGTLVTPFGFICDRDRDDAMGGCGCARSFSSFTDGRATTTAIVVERPDLDEAKLHDIALRHYTGAWGEDLAPQMARAGTDDAVWAADEYPVGTILRRRLSDLVPVEAAATAEPVELVVPVGGDLTTAERMYGNGRANEIVLRGGRADIGAVLVKALADLTGDPVIAALGVDDLVCAVRTLGEVVASGMDIDPQGELSRFQREVSDRISGMWADSVHEDEDVECDEMGCAACH